jgi:hypothetical protein
MGSKSEPHADRRTPPSVTLRAFPRRRRAAPDRIRSDPNRATCNNDPGPKESRTRPAHHVQTNSRSCITSPSRKQKSPLQSLDRKGERPYNAFDTQSPNDWESTTPRRPLTRVGCVFSEAMLLSGNVTNTPATTLYSKGNAPRVRSRHPKNTRKLKSLRAV